MKTGDLVFTQTGPDGNAISSVTRGFRGARPDHMGVIQKTAFGIFVLEAFPPEVRLTHIDVFLRISENSRGESRYMVGRLKNQYLDLIDEAMSYGMARRDIPYDQLYLTDENKLYCSELVVDMFKHSNSGNEFFPEHPMSFRDSESGIILQYWVNYYAYFGMTVPSGEPGSNPGDISLDSRIEIILINGPISGLEQ